MTLQKCRIIQNEKLEGRLTKKLYKMLDIFSKRFEITVFESVSSLTMKISLFASCSAAVVLLVIQMSL